MAGHSKFKNIQHRKGAQDKKRAKLFTRLAREIITSAKAGPDVSHNPKLRAAVAAAKAHNLPKDRIDRAINQANDPNTENYDEIRYEGFAPGGIALIVETLTDNRNRTASSVRAAFTKAGGNLGETGSVSYMFDHVGIIIYPATVAPSEKMLEIALEVSADDVESDEEHHIIYTSVENFAEASHNLIEKLGAPEESHLGWRPQNLIAIDDPDRAAKLMKLIDTLEDNDDVQNVFGNYDISESAYNASSS